MRDNDYPEAEYEEELDQDEVDRAVEFAFDGEGFSDADKTAFIEELTDIANTLVEEEAVDELATAIVREVVALVDNETQGYHVIPRTKENQAELAPLSLSERLWELYTDSSET